MIEKSLDKKAIKRFNKHNPFKMINTLPDIKKESKLLSWKPKIDL